MLATENEFRIMSNREFWVTSDKRKLYPSDFEDGHLVNTIQMMKRKAREYRISEVRRQVESAFNIKHDKGIPDEHFDNYYRKFTKFYYDRKISDTDWLLHNSKIYNLLLEEAKFRELDLSEQDGWYYGGTLKKKAVTKRIPTPTLWA